MGRKQKGGINSSKKGQQRRSKCPVAGCNWTGYYSAREQHLRNQHPPRNVGNNDPKINNSKDNVNRNNFKKK